MIRQCGYCGAYYDFDNKELCKARNGRFLHSMGATYKPMKDKEDVKISEEWESWE